MISSQVGELRFMAYMLDTDGHPSFAREVRRAADTIWELRCKLAGTIDQSEEIEQLKCENVELRQKRDYLLADESPMASEALADVRGWLCDNLSEGDAGKICGMLSVVSRHIVALEEENAKLRKAMDFQALELGCMTDDRDILYLENEKLRRLARGLNWCTENAKVPSAECERCPLGDTFYEDGELSCEKLMRELRIEVDE